MSKESSLAPYVAAARHKWRNRTVPGRILNTMEELGFKTRSGMIPELIEATKTDFGWTVIFNLPPSISADDIKAKLNYFQEQVKGSILLHNEYKTIYFDVSEYQYPREIPYLVDYSKYPKMFLPLMIGVDPRGKSVVVDQGDMHHLLLGGPPGTGKSNFIHQRARGDLEQGVITVIINWAKLEHNYLRNHAILVSDKPQTKELLRLLNKEMDRRQFLLEGQEAVKIQEFRGDMLPISIIIDEFADMDDGKVLDDLNRILRLGRNVGVWVTAASQNLSAKLFKSATFTELRRLFSGRLAFRCNDRYLSDMILESDSACHLPSNRDGEPVPGMAVFKFGSEKVLKTMYYDVKKARQEIKHVRRPEGVSYYHEHFSSPQVFLPR